MPRYSPRCWEATLVPVRGTARRESSPISHAVSVSLERWHCLCPGSPRARLVWGALLTSVSQPEAGQCPLLVVGLWNTPCPVVESACAQPQSAAAACPCAGADCGPWWDPGAAPPGPAMLCLSQMSYELWRDLEEESEGDSQGRKPEIGNIFLMDRGRRAGLTWRRVSRRRGQGEAVLAGRGGAGDQPGPALVADTDYVTALCSQVVYEGLVDDTFRIKCGRSAGPCSGRASGFVPGVTPGFLCCSQGCSHRDSPGAGCHRELSPWSGWASHALLPLAAAPMRTGVSGAKRLFHPLQGVWTSGQMSPLLTRALRCCSTPRTRRVLTCRRGSGSPALGGSGVRLRGHFHPSGLTGSSWVLQGRGARVGMG